MSGNHPEVWMESPGWVRLPLGLLMLLVAAWAIRALHNPQPMPVEWLFPLRGRWLAIFLTVVPGLLATWLLSPCVLVVLTLPLMGAWFAGFSVEWLVGRRVPRLRRIVEALGVAFGLYLLFRPVSVSAISPDRQLEARAIATSWLLTLAEETYFCSADSGVARYSLVVRDLGTGERAVLIDDTQGSVWEHACFPVSISWRAGNRRLTCEWTRFEFNTSDTFAVKRGPLRFTEAY